MLTQLSGLIKEFESKYGAKPNTLLLGAVEWGHLVNYFNLITAATSDIDFGKSDIRFLGLRVLKLTGAKSILAVGLMDIHFPTTEIEDQKLYVNFKST